MRVIRQITKAQKTGLFTRGFGDICAHPGIAACLRQGANETVRKVPYLPGGPN
jgi:hypothetical protein